MATKKQCPERHFVHFICNNVSGFVEIEPNGDKWVVLGGARIAYNAIKGGLKNVVHSVMVAHTLVSCYRG